MNEKDIREALRVPLQQWVRRIGLPADDVITDIMPTVKKLMGKKASKS